MLLDVENITVQYGKNPKPTIEDFSLKMKEAGEEYKY